MAALQAGERRDCSACGRKMVGARAVSTGNVMPVVVEPHENGNVLLFQKDGVVSAAVVGDVVVRGWLHDHGVPMRVNHFADCPDAARFERGGDG